MFTDEDEQLRLSVRRWIAQHVVPHVPSWERDGALPPDLLARLGGQGLLGLQVPTHLGGQGGDFVTNMIVSEELSAAGAESVSAAVSVHTGMAMPPIVEFGTDNQRSRYLPGLIDGTRVAALAITEPNAGSDVSAIETRAVPSAGGWRINGRKVFISNGTRADLILVIARTGERPDGRPTFTLFLIDAPCPGLERRRIEKIGRHASDWAELLFVDVEVGPEAVLGEVGRGFQNIMWELEAERVVAAATAVAAAHYVLGLALSYVRTRHQFGQPIGEFQAIRHRLADLAAQLAAAEELVYSVASDLRLGRDPGARIPMAKLLAASTLNEVADYAVQVHGAYGYTAEYSVGRAWVDARAKRISGGSDEIQRDLIARALLGRPSADARVRPGGKPVRGLKGGSGTADEKEIR
jgi:alkylation response protein AidB-like acyl-CoA dehydrogenase